MSEERMMQVGDILTDEQISKVEALLQSDGGDFDKCNAVKKYLWTFKDELEKKGVVADYLAYVIVYKIYGGQNGHTKIPSVSDN